MSRWARVLGFVALLVACGPGPDEPRRVAFGRVVCDWCGMLVADPHFAAQLVTREGKLLVFDDPICVFRYIADRGPSIAHLWFHDSTSTEERWVDWQHVGFAPADQTPMDGGLAAVPVGTDHALTFAEASTQALSPPARNAGGN